MLLYMRNLIKTTTIRVSEENRKRIETDTKVFEKSIGGGKWSHNDTITEYLKIINSKPKNR